MSEQQKSILLTGCSSGIGWDAAHGLKARGWRVFATCRKVEDCERLIGEGLESFPLDYTDDASMAKAIEEVLKRTGGTLDALFNNGAIGVPGAVEDLPTDALRTSFETNFFGYHSLVRMVLPIMREQGHGRIIQCSSVLGFSPLRWRGSYVAAKYALAGLTNVLRMEMAETEVKVILIEPGPITSRIRQNSIEHFERWIDWKNSPRRAQYEESLLDRLYKSSGPDLFELPAEAVTKKLVRALEDSNPKPRYFVTTPTYLMEAARRLLPTRLLDWVIVRG